MKTILEKTKTERSIRNVYLIAFILLFLSYIITLYANRQLVKQAHWVEHANKVIHNLDGMMGKTTDAETGIRGYVLTKRIEFLAPFYKSKEIVDSLYDETYKLNIDNAEQNLRLTTLKKDIDERFGQFNYGKNAFEQNNRERTDSMKNMREASIRLMNNIRNSISTMQRGEKKLLSERESMMKKTFAVINTITIVSLAIAFSLVFFGLVTYMRVSKERRKAKQELIEYEEQLKNRIDELDNVNTELIKMRSQEKFAVTGRIARAIAHEVRNPLTNINLATEQLKSEMPQKDENSGFLFDMINRNSNRINQLISDLLNSTKFSELNYEKIPVNSLLDETLEEAGDRIALNKVTLRKKYTKSACNVSVDKVKIKIAFLNIIINAIEAMDEGEEKILTVETRTDSKKCKIIISDNGIGMDNESVGRLFEAYFTNKPKGNGLGLTNTQNIILNHNGEISVESVKGAGTSFTITLDCIS